jgi:hypothetical protein
LKNLITLLFIILASQVNAEIIELACKHAKSGTVGTIKIDKENKRVKENNLSWRETIFWGNDYIIYRNPESDMMPFGRFAQFDVRVLNRKNLILLSSSITSDNFFDVEYDGDAAFDGNPSVVRCRRGF